MYKVFFEGLMYKVGAYIFTKKIYVLDL